MELNALQALIAEHCENTGESLTDIAERGGLPRQTVSGLMNRTGVVGMPHRSTVEKLAQGLQLSVGVVVDAAAQAAGHRPVTTQDHRVTVLTELARMMPPREVDVLLATARALARQTADTP